jgi:hypothetical protein
VPSDYDEEIFNDKDYMNTTTIMHCRECFETVSKAGELYSSTYFVAIDFYLTTGYFFEVFINEYERTFVQVLKLLEEKGLILTNENPYIPDFVMIKPLGIEVLEEDEDRKICFVCTCKQ